MIKTIIVTILFLASFNVVQAQLIQNADSAFTLAKEKNKTIMLVFSGTDWCAQCMRFDKRILRDAAFVNFIDTSLIVVEADFPQSKKLPLQKVEQNEALAKKYNPSGAFPLILLLNADRKVQVSIKYENESAQDFITSIIKYLL